MTSDDCVLIFGSLMPVREHVFVDLISFTAQFFFYSGKKM